MMKWKEQLNGDCPRRDAHSMLERCDLLARVCRRRYNGPPSWGSQFQI